MPSKDDHLNQAIENVQFGQDRAPGGDAYDGWAITVKFYVAAHLMRGYIAMVANRSVRFTSHRDAEEKMKRMITDLKLLNTYEELRDLSEEARYNCLPKSTLALYVPAAETALRDIKAWANAQGLVI
jgi:hypothetical protein